MAPKRFKINKATEEQINKERSQTFKQHELPSKLKRTLYVSYGVGRWNSGCINFTDYKPRSNDGFESVIIGLAEATAIIETKQDIKGKLLKVLEDQKQEVLAENHRRLMAVQDKIDNLLALTYEPSSSTESDK